MAILPKDEYNLLLMINRDLEAAVKEVVLDDIVKQQLKEFEKKIRPLVKEEVEKLTFKGISKMQGMMDIRNDLRLYVQWSDEDKAHLLEKVQYAYKCEETVTTTEVDI